MAISFRIVRQISRDRRSIGLIFFAPLLVMSLVGFSFADQRDILDRTSPALIATFVLFFTFLLTGVSFLRERAHGTLERLLITPVGSVEIILGYMFGFLLFAAIQALLLVLFTVLVLQINYLGSLWQVIALLMLLTFVAVGLGIFVSTFAHNEFQVVQFIPVVLAPQVFLSGIILPVDQLPAFLEGVAYLLPLTYAVEALREMMLQGSNLSDVVVPQLVVLVGYASVLLIAASATVKRS
jgi:ABC-2 type transport system permease protein